MANTSTLQSTTYVPDRKIGKIWTVLTYRVSIDTINSDLNIKAADSLKHCGLVAHHGVPAGAGDLIWKSGATQLTKMSFAANQGLDYRLGPPILWSEKNEALVIRSGVILDNFLVSVVEWGRNMPGL